jgi:hypothetical protein
MRSKVVSGKAVVFGAAALVALMLGIVLVAIFLGRMAQPFRDLPEFPAQSYRDGQPLWTVPAYRLRGRLQNIVAASEDQSAYLIILASEKSKGNPTSLPVIVPTSASQVPLQREQRLVMSVSLGRNGEIVANECLVE